MPHHNMPLRAVNFPRHFRNPQETRLASFSVVIAVLVKYLCLQRHFPWHSRYPQEPRFACFSVIIAILVKWLCLQSHFPHYSRKKSVKKFSLRILSVCIIHDAYIVILRINTPSRNRTCNLPLGGACYIHLTMRAYLHNL